MLSTRFCQTKTLIILILSFFCIIMSRSLKKGLFLSTELFVGFLQNKINFSKARSSIIAPDFISKQFDLHSGRSFLRVKIFDVLVGKKLGELVNTRKSSSLKRSHIFSKLLFVD
jgi:ribosomal protein S19